MQKIISFDFEYAVKQTLVNISYSLETSEFVFYCCGRIKT